MIPFLNAALSASTGKVSIRAGDTPHAGAVILGGQAYGSNLIYGTTTAVDVADTPIGGVLCNSDGIVRTYDATVAVPSGAVVSGGIAITSSGQLCYTTGAPTAASTFLGGMAVRNDGAVHATLIAP